MSADTRLTFSNDMSKLAKVCKKLVGNWHFDIVIGAGVLFGKYGIVNMRRKHTANAATLAFSVVQLSSLSPVISDRRR